MHSVWLYNEMYIWFVYFFKKTHVRNVENCFWLNGLVVALVSSHWPCTSQLLLQTCRPKFLELSWKDFFFLNQQAKWKNMENENRRKRSILHTLFLYANGSYSFHSIDHGGDGQGAPESWTIFPGPWFTAWRICISRWVCRGGLDSYLWSQGVLQVAGSRWASEGKALFITPFTLLFSSLVWS